MVVAGVPEVDHSDGSDSNGGGGARAEVQQQQQHAFGQGEGPTGFYAMRRAQWAQANDQWVIGAMPATRCSEDQYGHEGGDGYTRGIEGESEGK